jgi:AsmA protein
MHRKIIAGLAVLTILVVIALLAAPKFVDVNHYRPLIETKMRERLGRNVSLGPMKLSLLPLAFRVDNAVVADDPASNSPAPFVRVQTLYVRPKFLPLLRERIEIKNVELERPTVELIRNEQGTWNIPTLVESNQTGQAPGDFTLENLKIDDGLVAITDRQARQPRAVYDHIDLQLSDFNLDKSFSMDLRAHLPGGGQEVVSLQGKAGPLRRDAMIQTPLDGTLNLSAVSLSGLQRFLHLEALQDSDAVLTGTANVHNASGNIASDGRFSIQNPRVRGVDIGYPISIDYQVRSNMSASTAQIDKANIKLGSTPISLHGTLNLQSKPAQIDATMQASNASIGEAARLAAAFGAAFNAKSNISGSLNVDVHAQGPVTNPAMNGKVEARNVRISGGEFREPVLVDAVNLSLAPDAIRSNEFTAKTGRTSATGQVTLTDYASNTPKVQAKLNTDNADIEGLLRIAHAYGIAAMDGVNGSGSITLNASVAGPLKQTDQLAFDGSGEIRNASLEIPPMARPLAVRRADIRFSGNGASLNNLDVSLGQTTIHGDLVAKNFAAPQVRFSVAANRINVAEWEQIFQARPARPGERGTQAAAARRPAEESLISRTAGTGTLTADQIIYDELTVNDVRSTVTLDHGVITAKPLNANLYNGQQAGTVVVNTRTTPATYTVDSKLDNVDANELLSAVSPVKQTLYGLLSANADTHFTTVAGARSILPTLNGKVSLNLKNGKIAKVDLLHELGSIAQFTGVAKAVEPFTQLIQLSGNFDIKNGVARTNDLKAAIEGGNIAVDGAMDFAQQRLNLHLTAVLSQPYSQTVGGTGIGGFLNTALANKQGELVIPVLVTGTFTEPKFAPDLQKVAQMKLQNLVPGFENPSKAATDLLEELRGRTKPGLPAEQQQQKPQAPQNQPKPESPLNNFFDLFKNKR